MVFYATLRMSRRTARVPQDSGRSVFAGLLFPCPRKKILTHESNYIHIVCVILELHQ